MDGPERILGIDENGLGPLLGPLVVSGARVLKKPGLSDETAMREGVRLGIADSKVTASSTSMRHAESIALGSAMRVLGRSLPTDTDWYDHFIIESEELLTRRCPSSAKPQCWGAPIELPCFGGDATEGLTSILALEKKGVRLEGFTSSVSCAERLNHATESGVSKFVFNLNRMEDVFLKLQTDATNRAVFGMVGGIRKYKNYLSTLKPSVWHSGKSFNQGNTFASFEVDADANHLPVAWASMIGKYVRELWMLRLHRFFAPFHAATERVSGYYDPRTVSWVLATDLIRRKKKIPDRCFLRDHKSIADLK